MTFSVERVYIYAVYDNEDLLYVGNTVSKASVKTANIKRKLKIGELHFGTRLFADMTFKVLDACKDKKL
jgi:hypothetical protein